MQQVLMDMPDAPAGYRYTGEFRTLKRGDWYVRDLGGHARLWDDHIGSQGRYFILRKIVDKNNPEPGYRLVTDWEKEHCVKPDNTKYWVHAQKEWDTVCRDGVFCNSNTYAVPVDTVLQKSKPAWEAKFDWSAMPAWVNYVAMVRSGDIIGHEYCPTWRLDLHFWYNSLECGTLIPKSYAPNYPADIEPEDSLIIRPGIEKEK